MILKEIIPIYYHYTNIMKYHQFYNWSFLVEIVNLLLNPHKENNVKLENSLGMIRVEFQYIFRTNVFLI